MPNILTQHESGNSKEIIVRYQKKKCGCELKKI